MRLGNVFKKFRTRRQHRIPTRRAEATTAIEAANSVEEQEAPIENTPATHVEPSQPEAEPASTPEPILPKEQALEALQHAAKENNTSQAQQLLQRPENDAFTPQELGQILVVACKGNNTLEQKDTHDRTAMAQALLNAGADVNVQDQHGSSPLMWATINDHPNLTQLLINNKAQIKQRDRPQGTLGYTSLILAAAHNSYQAAKVLIKNKANVNAENTMLGDGKSALAHASQNGFEAMAALLIESSANVNFADQSSKITPLMQASEGGHAATVQLLVDQGANVHLQNSVGATALSNACYMGNVNLLDRGNEFDKAKETTKILLNAGAIPSDSQSNNGTFFNEAWQKHVTQATKALTTSGLPQNLLETIYQQGGTGDVSGLATTEGMTEEQTQSIIQQRQDTISKFQTHVLPFAKAAALLTDSNRSLSDVTSLPDRQTLEQTLKKTMKNAPQSQLLKVNTRGPFNERSLDIANTSITTDELSLVVKHLPSATDIANFRKTSTSCATAAGVAKEPDLNAITSLFPGCKKSFEEMVKNDQDKNHALSK